MTDIAVRTNGGLAQVGFFTTADKRQRDTLEAKRTHFTLGNHPRISQSQAKLTYQNFYDKNDQFGKQGSALMSNKSNFEFGDPRLKSAFYVTTYGSNTDSRKYLGFQRVQKIENKNFSSSI
jgi:hypothetical protein